MDTWSEGEVMQDVPTMSGGEEFAVHMVLRGSCADMGDFVTDMVLRGNDASSRDLAPMPGGKKLVSTQTTIQRL